MVAKHYPHPHRFLCITDNVEGLEGIQTLPLWSQWGEIPPPSGPKNPSCYRRLRLFAPDAREWAGERVVSLDLDCVVTGDLTPLWQRPEDVVFYGDTNPKTYYNGSMMLLRTGSRPRVWTSFDPVESPRRTYEAGHHGSDQAWISYCLGPHEAKWTRADGVYSYRNHLAQTWPCELPDDARLVIFHGRIDPWSEEVSDLPWIQRHYFGNSGV